MKKKMFFQISIVLYIMLIFFLTIIVAIIYAIIKLLSNGFNNSTLEWIYLISAILGLAFISYLFIKMAKNRIILKSTEIFVPANWGNKKSKIQYETKISYKEIQNIFMISSYKNSINQKTEWVFIPMPYIVFDCSDNKQKAINVYYYSKKQIIKIIDEIRIRAKNLGNNNLSKSGNEILSSFLETQKNKKK